MVPTGRPKAVTPCLPHTLGPVCLVWFGLSARWDVLVVRKPALGDLQLQQQPARACAVPMCLCRRARGR